MLRKTLAAACIAGAAAFTAPAAPPGRVQSRSATSTGAFAARVACSTAIFVALRHRFP